jgi:hypothetical protein
MTRPLRRVTVCVALPLPAVIVALRVRPPGPVSVAVLDRVWVVGSALRVTVFDRWARARFEDPATNRAASRIAVRFIRVPPDSKARRGS